MSKTKEIITIEHTLKEVLKNLSDQDIQDITGKSKSYIYKCADPDDSDRNIQFRTVIRLEHAMHKIYQKTPFSNFLKDYLATAQPEKPASESEVQSEILAIGGRLGDLMDAVRESMDEKSSGGSLGFRKLPDFSLLDPTSIGVSSKLDLKVRESDDYFALRFFGFVHVPTNGIYTFYADSDDGSKIFIHDKLVVDNDYTHGMTEVSLSLIHI